MAKVCNWINSIFIHSLYGNPWSDTIWAIYSLTIQLIIPFAGVKFKASITYVCCASLDIHYFFYITNTVQWAPYASITIKTPKDQKTKSLQILGTKQDIKPGAQDVCKATIGHTIQNMWNSKECITLAYAITERLKLSASQIHHQTWEHRFFVFT